MSTPDTAATQPVCPQVIGVDPVTGELITWGGRGRKPDHADAVTRDLVRHLGYADALFSKLLATGDPHLGRFRSEVHLKRLARRVMAMSNRAFNACRASEAAGRRRVAEGSGEGMGGRSCQEVEAAR